LFSDAVETTEVILSFSLRSYVVWLAVPNFQATHCHNPWEITQQCEHRILSKYWRRVAFTAGTGYNGLWFHGLIHKSGVCEVYFNTME